MVTTRKASKALSDTNQTTPATISCPGNEELAVTPVSNISDQAAATEEDIVANTSIESTVLFIDDRQKSIKNCSSTPQTIADLEKEIFDSDSSDDEDFSFSAKAKHSCNLQSKAALEGVDSLFMIDRSAADKPANTSQSPLHRERRERTAEETDSLM